MTNNSLEDLSKELALARLSSPEDNLPFQVILQLPACEPPRIRIHTNEDNKELAQILIPKSEPVNVQDIDVLSGNLSETNKMIIFKWMLRKSKRFSKSFNWEVMNDLWGFASD